MKIKYSIQKRIRLYFVTFTLVLSAFYSLLLLGYSWLIEDNIFNRLVNIEAQYIQEHYKSTSELSLPRLPFMKLYNGWKELPDDVYQQHIHDFNRIEFNLKTGGSLHIKELVTGDKPTILAADVSGYEVSRDYLPKISLGLVIIILMISLMALYISIIIARVAVKPLGLLTNKVMKSSASDIEEGFSKEFHEDEIGYLANAFENSILKMQRVLQREKNFTRDVSHELRTPTTILKNIVTQININPTLNDKSIRQLREAVSQQALTVTTLLALAREESVVLEEYSLISVMEECIINHYELNQNDSFELELDITNNFSILANKNLMKILIDNLLSNAIHYSSESQLKISTKDNKIFFENSRPLALDLAVIGNPFEANVKGYNSSGLGLGLNLVKRVCRSFNWDVELKSDSNKFCIIISI